MTTRKLSTVNLSELLKRVPPNQMKQFEAFRDKTLKYHRKVNKYPENLPNIDWEYYRQNVRKDYIKMVEQFQVKYEELSHVFASRHEILDHGKYYIEWQQLEAEVCDEVKRFVEDSMSRVKLYQDRLRYLKNLRYENMTIEQFVEAREDIAHFVPGQGKPLFWPHTPEEQLVDGGDIVNEDTSQNKEIQNQDK